MTQPTPAQIEAAKFLFEHYLNCYDGNMDAAAVEFMGLLAALTAAAEIGSQASEDWKLAQKAYAAAEVGEPVPNPSLIPSAEMTTKLLKAINATIERCAQVAVDLAREANHIKRHHNAASWLMRAAAAIRAIKNDV